MYPYYYTLFLLYYQPFQRINLPAGISTGAKNIKLLIDYFKEREKNYLAFDTGIS